MTDRSGEPRLFCSTGAFSLIPRGHLREIARDLTRRAAVGGGFTGVVALASELLAEPSVELPSWVDADTRYLVVADVPEPALLRLPSALGLHKPHLRLHVTRDPSAVPRVVVAQTRPEPWEGVVDAYLMPETLVVVLGDLTIREFPTLCLPRIKDMADPARQDFEIDASGSFLHWPQGDVHLGPSQMLQAVDPTYLADVEVRRYAREKVSLALHDMRTERGLTQAAIPGLSERHVRRLENEEGVRLTVEAARAFATAFDLSLSDFLAELGRRLATVADRVSAP